MHTRQTRESEEWGGRCEWESPKEKQVGSVVEAMEQV